MAPDGTATFDELDRAADRAALALRDRGVAAGDRVVVWLPKSRIAVALQQGILRLGAVYVPCDPLNPISRVASIAGSCGSRAVIGPASLAGEFASAELPDGCVRLLAEGMDPFRDGGATRPLPRVIVEVEALAYILFTSGSTGRPKGVCISHRAAMAFVDWAAGILAATSDDRFANHAPLHFDLSVLDFYAAWSCGACVVMVQEMLGYSPQSLVRLIVEQRITIWYSVPFALQLMIDSGGLLDAGTPALRALLFAGEPFPIRYVRALRARFPTLRLWNLYGPTETNVCAAYEILAVDERRHRPVPIGSAAAGNRIWAVDERGRETRIGGVGELMVAGPTVMSGYWGGEPQLNRPYATGDLVRRLASEQYEYVGRRDAQAKIRGYRIEPGEIEAVLLRHDQVVEGAVVVVKTSDRAFVTAFVVTRDPRPGGLALRRHCASLLPSYMIPDRFLFVIAIPRNRNGKRDIEALRRSANESMQQP